MRVLGFLFFEDLFPEQCFKRACTGGFSFFFFGGGGGGSGGGLGFRV